MQFQDPSSLIEGEPGQIPSNQTLWTYWHQSLSHLSKNCMCPMAQDGGLPKQLATCEVPLCPSCIAGKSTQRAWRANRDTAKKARTISSLGQLIYVDQLESPTSGFIRQIKSPRLTIHRYCVTTIFIDAFSDFTFLWHQTSTNNEQTLRAKHAFERLQLQTMSPSSITMQKMEDF
jgi:hypothetical protein